MPPFFFRDAGDDGILRFFDALLAQTGALRSTILLYNFPKMSGITFHADLVDRLMAAFPGAIGGMKDSSNDVALQRELLARHPELRVFPSTEETLVEAKSRGARRMHLGKCRPLATACASGVCKRRRRCRRAGAQCARCARREAADRARARRASPRRATTKAWLRAMPPN